MPRFSIKDLLIGTALLAAGITSVCGIARLPSHPVVLLLWLGGSALVGAGLFAPFKRIWLGAAIGLAVAILPLVVLTLAALYH
jgi:hypothetical protein